MRYWDSSALVPLIVEQDASATVASLIISDAGIATWWGSVAECTSAISRLERIGELDTDGAELSLRKLEFLRRQWHEIEPSEPVRKAALRALRLHPLAAADAFQAGAVTVFAGGESSETEVICLDSRLGDSLRREGFTVLGVG